jgi:amino acid transporter
MAYAWDDAWVTHEPEPSVIEWGSDRLRQLGVAEWPWRLFAAWLLATAGWVTAVASLVARWQVMDDSIMLGPDRADFSYGLGMVSVWGTGWVLGAMALAACTGLALLGPRPMRIGARAVGLAAGGVLLAYLVAAAAALRQTNQSIFTIGNPSLEISVGSGVYLAFVAVLSLSAAAWFASPTARLPSLRRVAVGRPEEEPPAPSDLTVEPAEPWVTPPNRLDGGR